MKRSAGKAIAAAGSRNPSVVTEAFAPDAEYVLTLDGWILLESLKCAYVTGQVPTMRDTILCLLVMTDEDAIFEAKRRGKIDSLIAAATQGKKPGDILALAPKIKEAFDAALEPTRDGVDHQKKSSAAAAGG